MPSASGLRPIGSDLSDSFRNSSRKGSSVSNRFVEQGLTAPVNLTWEVTLACNLRCRHCLSSSGKSAKGELATGEALELVEEIGRAKVFQVNFGGGEPFLRPDFEEILAACHERGIMTCISTNGTLLDRALVRRLGRTGLVAVQVSLDGARAETCDSLRGPGTFEQALQALRLLAGSPIPTSINAVLTATNASEVRNFTISPGACMYHFG